MQDSTYDALLSRALHPATPAPEATASIGRILANDTARARLRDQLSADPGDLRQRYDHNAEELRRAIRTIATMTQEAAEHQRLADRLHREREAAVAELQRLRERIAAALDDSGDDDQNGRGAERENRYANTGPEPSPRPRATGSGGSGYRRRPRSIVELDADSAVCADCGAELHRGDPVRVYPGGRVFGTECHGRRARA